MFDQTEPPHHVRPRRGGLAEKDAANSAFASETPFSPSTSILQYALQKSQWETMLPQLQPNLLVDERSAVCASPVHDVDIERFDVVLQLRLVQLACEGVQDANTKRICL
jgi:hypothetical protein